MNGRFPGLAALEEAGAFAVSDAALPYTLQRALDRFAFGLDLVLDAVGARVAAARPWRSISCRGSPGAPAAAPAGRPGSAW
ncbi:hypothetical protein ACFOY2_25440 [Nonomuraea purpurea]|uniref:Uncharacterized protein n=1 Tax=Nonomuraea purpurea TaxID=1849276 RepID=A0ABV8G9D3_9ACTN